MQFQASRIERRPAVVGEGAAHREAVVADGLRRGVGALFQRPFDRPHAPHVFLQVGFGVAVGLEDRPRRLA